MKLKKTRKSIGMSQYELAAKAKVSREYIRQLEAGRSDPTVGMLEKLAKALGLTIPPSLLQRADELIQ